MTNSKLIETFSKNSYLVFQNNNQKYLDKIILDIKKILKNEFDIILEDLSDLHNYVDKTGINKIRLSIFNKLNSDIGWEKQYFKLAEKAIKELLGPDLSIQIKLNFSIQLPGDETSILMLHSDTLSGQSSYELVLWTALTNAFETNAMYMFDKAQSKKMYNLLPKYQYKGMEKLLNDKIDLANIMKVNSGHCILFSSTLFHGNRLNETNKTRMSLNCRFKSLFSPEYSKTPHERVTGTFYKPFTFSPVTELGLNYNDEIDF